MYKVAFIGACGHVYNVFDVLHSRDDIVICGISKGSELEEMDSFHAFLQKEGYNPRVYADYRELLDQEKPDIAVVSTLFGVCADISIECLHRNIHVMSEKPVAATLIELDELEKAAKNSKAVFCAMHFLRHHPAFYTAGELIKDGCIGQVRLINVQKSYKFGTRPAWYTQRELYGGTIPWVGIHAIDWMYHYISLSLGESPVLNAVSALHHGSPEMYALCQYRFQNDVIASVSIDFLRPSGADSHGDDRSRVVGTDGVVEVQKGKVHLITKDFRGEVPLAKAPDLTEEFFKKIEGKKNQCIPALEIFEITRLALLARDAADVSNQ